MCCSFSFASIFRLFMLLLNSFSECSDSPPALAELYSSSVFSRRDSGRSEVTYLMNFSEIAASSCASSFMSSSANCLSSLSGCIIGLCLLGSYSTRVSSDSPDLRLSSGFSSRF